MTTIDFWYGNTIADVDRISIAFSDVDCVYRGNLYSHGRIIGDYTSSNSVELEKRFPQLKFRWEV